MFAKNVLTDEERAVDRQLGYPRGYAKLCRHACIQMQGLITPFTEGPPQRFHPYAPLEEELTKLKEFDSLFPILDEEERDPSNARQHADFLWQQLDHLGNAGFNPAKFRVDMYGNVVYWNADPGSPLGWEVDHWFPHSRGGKTVLSNLRIVQWQVNQRKSTKLEFLVPWWDLQMGVSVNQFLSVFSSKNVDFRQRAFSLFFLGGENEQLDDKLVVECHSWPQPFRERKHRMGLAAAAMVKVQKDKNDSLNFLNRNRALKQQFGNIGTPARRRWTLDEEEALRRALQKFGPGNWKEIKEFEPVLVNRSTVQIKDKYRLMRGEWQLDKENKEEPSDRYIAAIQREEKLKQVQEEERKQMEEDVVQLEEELRQKKTHNEKEKSVLEELEQTLAKQRKRVEKQRRWSETQSQYRLCLEKMIRDTMHQCVVYKEQARLNQAACNALIARLESQKSTCDKAEMDLVKRVKQRETLEALVRPKITKRTRNEGHTDVASCVKPSPLLFSEGDDNRDHHEYRFRSIKGSKTLGKERETPKSFEKDFSDSNGLEDEQGSKSHKMPLKEQDSIQSKVANFQGLDFNGSKVPLREKGPRQTKEQQDEDGQERLGDQMLKKTVPLTGSSESGAVKRKALEVSELDVVLLGYESGEQENENGEREESVGDNATHNSELGCNDADNGLNRGKVDKPELLVKQGRKCSVAARDDDEQLDELLQEVLEMKGKVNAAMADAIEDEEDEEDRVKRVGKFNLDKWLQMLLLNPGSSGDKKEKSTSEINSQNDPHVESHVPEGQEPISNHPHVKNGDPDADEAARGGIMGGFLKKLSFKQDQEGAEETNLAVPKNEVKAEKNGRSDKRRTSPWRRAASPSFKRAASVNRTGSAAAPLSRQKSKGPRDDNNLKMEERKVIESFSRLKLGEDGQAVSAHGRNAEEESEVVFQIACEAEFVEKMRAARKREQRRKWQQSAGVPPQLHDLMGDSSHCDSSKEQLECNRSLSAASLSPTLAKVDEQRRHSMVATPTQDLIYPSLSRPAVKKLQLHHHPQQTSQHRPTTPQQRQSERSLSTPPAQFRQAPLHPSVKEFPAGTPPAQLWRAQLPSTEELLKQQRQSYSQPKQNQDRQLLRQQMAGHAVGGGGAARKASMLMKSASTRGGGSGSRTTSSSGSGGSPARSSSVLRGGEGEVASLRRKDSFFQDWDANEGLRASLSHVWKKAVKKFDLARQQAQQ